MGVRVVHVVSWRYGKRLTAEADRRGLLWSVPLISGKHEGEDIVAQPKARYRLQLARGTKTGTGRTV